LSQFDPARFVIIGAGIAGASTAAALARAGAGPGLILEREPLPGVHASGKNAGIACLVEFDPVVRRLAVETVRHLRRLTVAGEPILRPAPAMYLGGHADHGRLDACAAALRGLGVSAEFLDRPAACARLPLLGEVAFDWAICSNDEGVIDIHALLLHYLSEARDGRFTLLTRTAVEGLRVDRGRVVGVDTSRGTIRADTVVDASGAWAGRLGRPDPLPLQPVRRHLFVSVDSASLSARPPVIWHVGDRFYLRAEGQGLLLCPCDETDSAPGVPRVDPAAADLLAEKLARAAPTLADLAIRSSWACLRTFAPDRRPIIGADPEIAGLYHVSGLGGFGMGTSWAIGDVASAVIRGVPVPYVSLTDLAPDRLAAPDRH
jgi:D-arginine dehydrogenase